MANNLVSNPWIIDTPTLFSLCTGNWMKIKSIRWEEATTAGHICELVDDGSNILFRSVASGSNFVEAELIENKVNLGRTGGLRASALQSGRLLISLL